MSKPLHQPTDRFACFVVGEVRDNRGNYYDFVGDTVEAFKAAGLNYYKTPCIVTGKQIGRAHV